MPEMDHRKIAAECAVAAAATKSLGDRQQLLQIGKKHLELAELQEAKTAQLDLKNGITHGRSAA